MKRRRSSTTATAANLSGQATKRRAPTSQDHLCGGSRNAASLPTLATTTYAEVKNGDCLAFALASARMLAQNGTGMEGRTTEEREALGSSCRTEVERHIQDHWSSPCKAAGGLLYGDLVAMVHNQALPRSEREQYPDWGETLDDKLVGWLREREELYWGQAEIAAFVDLMEQQHGQRFTVRVWREFRPKGSPRHLQCLCTTPDVDLWDGLPSITMDLRHKGSLDGPTSHYALLRSGDLATTPE